MMKKNPIQGNKNIHELASLFSLFSSSQTGEKSASEICNELGMYPSKASRILGALESEGFMEKNPESGKYRIGIRFLELGMIYITNFPLRKIVRPHLEQMAKETKLTASMAILRGKRIICVERLQNFDLDILTQSMGINSPIYSTSNGKMFLAFLPEMEREEILDHTVFVKFTDRTIVDRQALREHLEVVRKNNYATDLGETYDNINCLAAPIKDETGKVMASLNLMGSASMIKTDNLSEIAGYLKDRALFISRQIGYRNNLL